MSVLVVFVAAASVPAYLCPDTEGHQLASTNSARVDAVSKTYSNGKIIYYKT